jgi:hypothetical protein
LRFNPDGTFKILQLTDLHYGENDAWDEQTELLQEELLNAEKPDLVVITGDMISGYAYRGGSGWVKGHYEKLLRPMIKLGYRWAMVLGNHDGEADWHRAKIAEFDASHALSMTQIGPENITGVTNFVYPIYSSASVGEVASRLYFFDSNAVSCFGVKGWGCVYPAQIEWYRRTAQMFKQQDGHHAKPAIAFQHIPIPEYMELWNYHMTYGTLQDEGICCAALNTGLYAAMKEMNDIKALWVGHDHKNDFYGDFYGITLGYGRKTGYGGYGPAIGTARGARVITLKENPFSFETYIREEGGGVDKQSSHNAGYPHYYTCCSKGDRYWVVLNRTVVITLTITVMFWWIVMGAIMIFISKRRKNKLKAVKSI